MKKWLAIFALIISFPVATRADIGFQGWGLRTGLSVDPDQIDIGAHFNLGEFIPNLRFQPNLELGFGDNIFLLMINGETFYLFDVRGSNFRPYAGGELSIVRGSNFRPYAGGELSIVYWRVDNSHGKNEDLEIGLSPVGGIEFPFSKQTMGFLELKLGIGDVPDFRVAVGIHI